MCTVLLPPGVNPIAVNKMYHKLTVSELVKQLPPHFIGTGRTSDFSKWDRNWSLFCLR